MSFSWLWKAQPVQDGVDFPHAPIEDSTDSFTNLVKQLEEEQEELATLRNTCQAQQKRLRELAQERSRQEELQRKNSSERSKLVNDNKLQATQLKKLRDSDQQKSNRIRNLETSNSQLNKAVNAANAELKTKRSLQYQFEDVQAKLVDAKFDLEYMKCTQQPQELSPLSNDQPLSSVNASPFVVVLIDGDGYEWAADIYAASDVEPGQCAASRIKQEVRRYILGQQSAIPVHAKIVCRHYRNDKGRKKYMKATWNIAREMDNFNQKFCESDPLFDHIDAGQGKERVDDKIKEIFYLFAANEHCHKVFLAASHDGGFARAVERFLDIASIRRKIVFIHAGYAAPEIVRLRVEHEQWPRVFAPREHPMVENARTEKMKEQMRGRLKWKPWTNLVATQNLDSKTMARKLHYSLSLQLNDHVRMPPFPGCASITTGLHVREYTIVDDQPGHAGHVEGPGRLEELD